MNKLTGSDAWKAIHPALMQERREAVTAHIAECRRDDLIRKIAKFALYAFATAVTMGIIYLTHWCVEFLR